MIRFQVLGRAQPAGSKRAFANPKTGKMIVTDDNRRSRPWKQEVAAVAYQAMAGGPLLTGPLDLRVVFYVARPRGHYGTGRNADRVRPSAPPYPAVKPDVTKLVRGLEDACTGVVWRDDAQVVIQRVRKVYGAPERADVEVRQLLAQNGTSGCAAEPDAGRAP